MNAIDKIKFLVLIQVAAVCIAIIEDNTQTFEGDVTTYATDKSGRVYPVGH